MEAVFTVDGLLPCLQTKRPTGFYSDATFGRPLAAETPQLPRRSVSLPRREACDEIRTHMVADVVMTLPVHVDVFARVQFLSPPVWFAFVRGPELAVSTEQCVH